MNDFDEDYTYHGPPLTTPGGCGKPRKWTGGKVTLRRLGEPYPPPPYDPHAYPAGPLLPDVRTLDQKVTAQLAGMTAAINRLTGAVAALHGDWLKAAAAMGGNNPPPPGEGGDHARG